MNEALIKQLEKGTSFGAPCELEVRVTPCCARLPAPAPSAASLAPYTRRRRPARPPGPRRRLNDAAGALCRLQNVLAKAVIAAVPSVEMVRFCNSGTEAWMGALRLMRAYTGRSKILKFEGCYHGHADPFLVQAGSGVATLGLPDSPGVPEGATAGTLCAPYNNLAAVKAIFEANPDSIAGIILEPVRTRPSKCICTPSKRAAVTTRQLHPHLAACRVPAPHTPTACHAAALCPPSIAVRSLHVRRRQRADDTMYTRESTAVAWQTLVAAPTPVRRADADSGGNARAGGG